MGLKTILVLVLIFILMSLTFLYFVPLNTINFSTSNYNFSIIQGNETMQFYPNMRFPTAEISYKISDCPLKKQNDMEFAFTIMENLTSLRFYPVSNNEGISITCQDKPIASGGGLFTAGEGGPTNITIAGRFNVITHGEILLIKESTCPKPNVALHELFHVLGFQHSTNPDNIMYNISKCEETIGDDMIQLINNLYLIPSSPDLAFEDASATMSGRFLDVNMTITNIGLNEAGSSKVDIYTDGNLLKEIDLEPFAMGNGRIITIENIFVSQININEIELVINNDFNELSKDNNNLTLEIKK